jgi:hypothetical protein
MRHQLPTTHSRSRRHPTAAAVTIAAAILAVSGCGSDDDVATGPVEVVAVDYAYEGIPERVRSGAEITVANESDREVHEVVAVRLPDDEERSVEELVGLPPQELAAFFPEVRTVLIAPPGEQGFAVEGTGVLDEPGRYALLCVIPTGADPGEYLAAAAEAEGGPPDVEGGAPHIAAGMYAELTVVE